MENETHPIKDYAEGWITEREGTDVPAFLKFAFIVIGGGCVSYIFVYMNGETTHSDRGPLVQALNQATTQADGLMTMVGLLAIVYVIAVVFFAFKGKTH